MSRFLMSFLLVSVSVDTRTLYDTCDNVWPCRGVEIRGSEEAAGGGFLNFDVTFIQK